MWLTSFYATVGIVYPTLVASPRFFAGAITLGVLMQITAAFGQVQTSLNYFVDNFPRLAEWRSHVERLLEFEEVLDTTHEATAEGGEVTSLVLADCSEEGCEEGLRFNDLQITTSDGNIVIAVRQYRDRQGRAGADRRSLGQRQEHAVPRHRRVVAVGRRQDRAARSQQDDVHAATPLSAARHACARRSPIPIAVEKFSPRRGKAALERCGLEHLVEKLDEEERWDRVLSGGEQQRLAFARAAVAQARMGLHGRGDRRRSTRRGKTR